ncbi:MAG TPA: hypothetical protein VMH32_26970 [Burkholderiales bacterium]|nr:hypothetical protein [Burkholderiales bacterium]
MGGLDAAGATANRGAVLSRRWPRHGGARRPPRTWELPALGTVTAPAAVLVPPDGYVAWVGDETQIGLADSLTACLGSPAPA